MSALPETIKALQILPEKKGAQVVTIPWASQEKVQSLADNEIIVRVLPSPSYSPVLIVPFGSV